MKKAIIINLLILIILNIQPKTSKVVASERKWSQSEQVSEQVTVQVTSRNSDSKRDEKNEEISVESDILQSTPTEISKEGLELIKKFEGLRLQSYRLDGEKNWTIGYGTSNASIYEGQEITEEQAEELLMQEVNKVTKQVLEYCEYLELTQNELSALVSFTYNTGFGNLQKLTGYQSRDKEEISEKILNYTKSKSEVNRNGLKKRRIAEQEMFKQSEQ